MTTRTGTPREVEHSEEFTVSLELVDGYAFRVDFDDDALEPLHTDEAPPLGAGGGPSPSRLLAAAVVNCLAASLAHCLRRARVEVGKLTADATVSLGRNDRGRLRIRHIGVRLSPQLDAASAAQLTRCAGIFQDYCTVTASIREGLDIDVEVAAATEAAP